MNDLDEIDEYISRIENLDYVQTIRDVSGHEGQGGTVVTGRVYPLGLDVDAPQMAGRLEREFSESSDVEVACKQPNNPSDNYYYLELAL